jgi:DNA-binding HxlR family transcriptional regulator
MSVIGGKWKPMLLYMIAEGVNRFNRLEKSIAGLTRHALNRSLREMETDGLLRKTVFEEKVLRVEYYLTPKGESLLPVVEAMYLWGKSAAAEPHPVDHA